MQEAALLTQNIPTKKRGIIWLISSLLVLGVVGFATFIYWIKAIVEFGKGLYTFFQIGAHNFGNTLQIFFALLGICLLAYIGVWYGAMLITASYKKYSIKKTRILALVLSIGTFSIALLTLNLA
jgi:hypothetical protein